MSSYTDTRSLCRRLKVTHRSEANALTHCEAVAHQEIMPASGTTDRVCLLRSAQTVLT